MILKQTIDIASGTLTIWLTCVKQTRITFVFWHPGEFVMVSAQTAQYK